MLQADAFTDNQHLVFTGVDATLQRIIVGLVFMYLTQIPLDQIDHRIEPEDDLRHGKQRQIEHVSQLPVSLLVGQDLLPVVRVIFVGNDHVFSERSRRHHPRQDDHLGPVLSPGTRLPEPSEQTEHPHNEYEKRHPGPEKVDPEYDPDRSDQNDRDIDNFGRPGDRLPIPNHRTLFRSPIFRNAGTGYSRISDRQRKRRRIPVQTSRERRFRNRRAGPAPPARRRKEGNRQRQDHDQQQRRPVKSETRLFPHQQPETTVKNAGANARNEQIDQ